MVAAPQEHSDKDAIRTMLRHAESAVFASLKTDRMELFGTCRERLRARIPALGTLWMDPFVINEVMLHTFSGCDITNGAKQRLLIDLSLCGLIQYNVLDRIVVEERLLSYVCTTATLKLKDQLFTNAMKAVGTVLHDAVDVTHVEDYLKRTFKYKKWTLKDVVLGTRYKKQYWTDTNDLFDSHKDADGTRQYTKPTDKVFRITEVSSKVYPCTYFQVEIPVTYYFVLPSGRRYGSTVHVIALEVSLVDDHRWRALENHIRPTLLDRHVLPSLTLHGHFLQKSIPFSTPTDNKKMHVLAFYAIMAYMHEMESHVSKRHKLRNLARWDLMKGSSDSPYLDHTSSVLRDCVRRLGEGGPTHAVYARGTTAPPGQALVLNLKYVAACVLRALETSTALSGFSKINFITPDTIE